MTHCFRTRDFKLRRRIVRNSIPLLAWGAYLFGAPLSGQDKRIENLAPYYSTPETIVDRMLKLGELKPGEKMFDLGSGDGRIVIMAAQKYSADATGIEFDGVLVKKSSQRIQQLKLSPAARIVHGDLMAADYRSADLLTIYLLPVAYVKLRPILERQLKAGARVVSHNSEIPGWTAVKVEDIENDGEGHSHKLYLYRR